MQSIVQNCVLHGHIQDRLAIDLEKGGEPRTKKKTIIHKEGSIEKSKTKTQKETKLIRKRKTMTRPNPKPHHEVHNNKRMKG
jgi:hypothetical protein